MCSCESRDGCARLSPFVQRHLPIVLASASPGYNPESVEAHEMPSSCVADGISRACTFTILLNCVLIPSDHRTRGDTDDCRVHDGPAPASSDLKPPAGEPPPGVRPCTSSQTGADAPEGEPGPTLQPRVRLVPGHGPPATLRAARSHLLFLRSACRVLGTLRTAVRAGPMAGKPRFERPNALLRRAFTF